MLYFQVYVPFPSSPCLLPFQQDVGDGQDESVEGWHIVWVQRGGRLVGGGAQVRVGWEGRLPMLPTTSHGHPAALWQVLPRLLELFLGSKSWPQKNNHHVISGPASPTVVDACKRNVTTSNSNQNATLSESKSKSKHLTKSITLFLSLQNKVIIQELSCWIWQTLFLLEH